MNTVTELLQPVENDLDDLILELKNLIGACLLYTSPSPRDPKISRMPSSA